MDNSDLTSGMQEMMAEMAAMRAELNELKASANALVAPPQPVHKLERVASTTRRKALLKLGGGLVAGLGASLPTFNVSAGPGLVTNSVNPNATSLVANNGSVTQTFAGINFKPFILPSTTNYDIETGYIQWLGGNGFTFFCPLALSQGVKVTNVTFYYSNADVNNVMNLFLTQINPATGTLSNPVNLMTPATTAFPQTISATGTAANPLVTIDNTLYSYSLGVGFSGYTNLGNNNQKLWGAKITYVNVTGHFQAQ